MTHEIKERHAYMSRFSVFNGSATVAYLKRLIKYNTLIQYVHAERDQEQCVKVFICPFIMCHNSIYKKSEEISEELLVTPPCDDCVSASCYFLFDTVHHSQTDSCRRVRFSFKGGVGGL